MTTVKLLQLVHDNVRVLSSDVVTENVLHVSVTVSSRVNVVVLMSDKVFTHDPRVTSGLKQMTMPLLKFSLQQLIYHILV